jgi:hypothetical protein
MAPIWEARERQIKTYAYDPHLDPRLEWAGKAEHTSFEVQTVSLHIHEQVATRAILEAAKRPEPQLKAQIDPEAFEQMRGTASFPFEPGKQQRIAVKVVDFRENEVVRVMPIDDTDYSRARR